MLPVSEGTEVQCLFMQEDISCSVTKNFSGHIETSEHGGMELPSKLSSTIIRQNTTALPCLCRASGQTSAPPAKHSKHELSSVFHGDSKRLWNTLKASELLMGLETGRPWLRYSAVLNGQHYPQPCNMS